MTAVLDEIRQLEAAHARGEMADTEFLAAKQTLMDEIEEAETASSPEPDIDSGNHVWHALLFSIFGLMVCTLLGTLILGNLSLALTAAVTLLAALTVRAFQTLDD